MTLRKILIHPDPRLKAVAAPVTDFDAELGVLAEDMLSTMYEYIGLGLAAPQLGISKRLIVVDCVKDDIEKPRPMALVNPEILWSSEETNVYQEGCLSFPDQFADVTRPAEVEVKWQDVTGEEKVQKFDGLWATCIQHEIDHLDGKLFIDYLKPMRRRLIVGKMKKIKREMARTS